MMKIVTMTIAIVTVTIKAFRRRNTSRNGGELLSAELDD